MIVEIILLGTFMVLLLHLFSAKRPKNFPPGPRPLPIIGNLHQMPSGHLFTAVKEWVPQHGQVIGLVQGRALMVVIDGVDNILEALRKEEFQSRPESFDVKSRSFGKNLGIFFGNGEQWASSRKFVMKNLKAYGKFNNENVIIDEIARLLDTIQDGSTIKGTGIFGSSAVNVIWTMIASKRIDTDDQRSAEFMDNLNTLFRIGSPSGNTITTVSPILRFVDPIFKSSMKIVHSSQQYIRDVINQHREQLDPNNPLDLIDHYLVAMQQDKEKKTFSEEDLIIINLDLFSAGAESTSNTIEYILLYMILYPDVQAKMQEEIDTVLGRSRKPRLEDKNKMHYTMAVITEGERINSVVPTNVPHNCSQDTTFAGYFIPKGTTIMMILRSLGHDPKYWKNPDDFNPERFLNENKEFSKPAFLATFGMGQRLCVGEMFARNTIFLFVTTFFEKFSISLPPGEPEPSTFPLPGFTTAPQPFNMLVKSRY